MRVALVGCTISCAAAAINAATARLAFLAIRWSCWGDAGVPRADE
jgi:hypothetical protein